VKSGSARRAAARRRPARPLGAAARWRVRDVVQRDIGARDATSAGVVTAVLIGDERASRTTSASAGSAPASTTCWRSRAATSPSWSP
jgi:hypothetical protein